MMRLIEHASCRFTKAYIECSKAEATPDHDDVITESVNLTAISQYVSDREHADADTADHEYASSPQFHSDREDVKGAIDDIALDLTAFGTMLMRK